MGKHIEVFRWIFCFTEYLSISLLGALGFALDVQPSGPNKKPIPLQGLIEFAIDYPTWLAVPFVIGLLVSKGLRHYLDPGPPEKQILDRQVNQALNRFRIAVFPEISDSKVQNHENRVTLFKKVDWRWWISPCPGPIIWPWGISCFPWSGWLVIDYRSGHLTNNSATAFPAASDGKSLGVAGRAYASGSCRVRVNNDINDEKSVGYLNWIYIKLLLLIGKSEKNDNYLALYHRVCKYSDVTFGTHRLVWKWVRRHNKLPKSILGIMIEDRLGSPWGVLVMDSCNDIECIDSNETRFKTALSKLKKEFDNLEVLR